MSTETVIIITTSITGIGFGDGISATEEIIDTKPIV